MASEGGRAALSRPLLIWISVLVAVAVVAGVALLVLPGRHSSSITADEAGPAAPIVIAVPTVLIIDASGSMTTPDAPGPRIDAAKAAAHGLLAALPDNATLGLMTYGTRTGSSDQEQAAGCADVSGLIPLGPLDRAKIGAAIDSLVPRGYTPISLALRTAAKQLPADDSAQAIVLVSDGEDTCGQPPCDVARELKSQHPGLAISTVGFRTDGSASEQLACIATATGGLFTTAGNSAQLAARLLATQNVDLANQSLSATGSGGIKLGQSATAIRSNYGDFPAVDSGDRVVVVWKDCEYTFSSGVLIRIAPRNGGRTIDGVVPGTQLQHVVQLYGAPLDSRVSTNGPATAWFAPADQGDSAYEMDVDGYAQSGQSWAGVVKRIVLCTCRPHPQPEQIVAVNPTDYEQIRDGNSIGIFFKDPTGKWWCHIDQGDVRCFRGGTGDELMSTLGIPGEPLVDKAYSSDGHKYPPNLIGIMIEGAGVPVAKLAFDDVGADLSDLQSDYAQTKTLDYDHSITVGGYTCVVRRSGISCDGSESYTVGRGFTFSDTGYSLR